MADAQKMRAQTGCDAVMVGRAALGNPWIFRELAGERAGVSSEERRLVVIKHLLDHIELRREIEAEENTRPFSMTQTLKSFRSHLMWYSTGLQGGAKFRQQVMNVEEYQATLDLIDEFFSGSKKSNEVDSGDDGIDYRQAFG